MNGYSYNLDSKMREMFGQVGWVAALLRQTASAFQDAGQPSNATVAEDILNCIGRTVENLEDYSYFSPYLNENVYEEIKHETLRARTDNFTRPMQLQIPDCIGGELDWCLQTISNVCRVALIEDRRAIFEILSEEWGLMFVVAWAEMCFNAQMASSRTHGSAVYIPDLRDGGVRRRPFKDGPEATRKIHHYFKELDLMFLPGLGYELASPVKNAIKGKPGTMYALNSKEVSAALVDQTKVFIRNVKRDNA